MNTTEWAEKNDWDAEILFDKFFNKVGCAFWRDKLLLITTKIGCWRAVENDEVVGKERPYKTKATGSQRNRKRKFLFSQ